MWKLGKFKFIFNSLSINIIEDNKFSDCLNLKSVKLNPELIKYLCKERIGTITISKKIKIIDETLFVEIHF